MKPIINEVIVVEGKTDTAKLQSLFNVITIETNGSHLSHDTITLIKKVAQERGVILFLDPDGPGEMIRRKLENSLIDFKQAFIKKTDIINNKKIGIAEASNEAIINALSGMISFKKNVASISWQEYLQHNWNKRTRKIVTDYLKIPESNNKQLFKHLNMMNVTNDKVKKIISSYKDR